MSKSTDQLLEIEPKHELYFEGPFDNVVMSHITLKNPLDRVVCFKVKTTVPKRYCVRPSSGAIEPNQELDVAVMLQPFDYDPSEKSKHKFMIQTLIPPEWPLTGSMDQLWKDDSKLVSSKLVCILRMPGELVIDPSHELIFEGPFTKQTSSTIKLFNPSSNYICFKVQTTSSKRFAASPSAGLLAPHSKQQVIVVLHPLDFNPAEKHRERIMLQSVVANEDTDPKREQTWKEGNVTDTLLRCVFRLPGMIEPTESAKVAHSVASNPESVSTPGSVDLKALMAELAALRKENATLKESDIRLRHVAFTDTYRASTDGSGEATDQSMGILGSVPLVIYLCIALFIGLLIGKFLL